MVGQNRHDEFPPCISRVPFFSRERINLHNESLGDLVFIYIIFSYGFCILHELILIISNRKVESDVSLFIHLMSWPIAYKQVRTGKLKQILAFEGQQGSLSYGRYSESSNKLRNLHG